MNAAPSKIISNYNASNFVQDYWRERTAVKISDFMSIETAGKYSKKFFFENVDTPVICAGYENKMQADGTRQYFRVKGFLIPEVKEVGKLFNHYKRSKEKITLFLYNLDLKFDSLNIVRNNFKVGHAFRQYDVATSISPKDSTIGYHADDKDVIIVQTQGTRRWKIWHPDVISEDYRNDLIKQGNKLPEPPEKTKEAPYLDVELLPGEAIYIPALWPHEGFTQEDENKDDSVSLSFSWVVLTPRTFFIHDWENLPKQLETVIESHPETFFSIIPDPIEEDPEVYYYQSVMNILKEFDLSEEEFGEYVHSRIENVFKMLIEFHDIKPTHTPQH